MTRFPGYPFTSRWYAHPARDGLRQHYVDEGSGPPVLFVHGNPSWSYLWRRPILALRDRFRCVAPDHLGMGLSDKPAAGDYDHTLASRVDDLDALVGHLIGRGAPPRGWTLVMHDWGGPIGMAWACRHPGRVARLVVLNTAAFPNPHGERVRLPLRAPLWVLRRPRLGTRLFLRHNLFARGATWRPLGVRRRMPADVRAAFLAPYDRPEHRVAVQRFVLDIPLRPGDPAWPLLEGTGRRLDRFAGLPAFIGWGLRDPVFDPAMLAEWRRRLPGAEVRVFPRAGHYVLEDAHERLVPAIRDFLVNEVGRAPQRGREEP